MHTPKLYLAGKISANDWRHPIVPALRGHTWAAGPIAMPDYTYVGPFFVACDQHGCGPIPGCDADVTALQVIENNLSAIKSATLILAYVTTNNCYGTLFEIGYARALGKRVVMAFAPNINPTQYWFSAGGCSAVYTFVSQRGLNAILAYEMSAA